MNVPVRALIAAAAVSVLACAAVAPPPEAFALAPIPADERAMQIRLLATDDEGAVLDACIAVLRAHGFAAEDQERALGLIVAVKDTESAGHRSRLRASIATQPAGEFGLETQLRITFQRLAWNARGREVRREAVREPAEYEGFFAEVSRALALPETAAR